MKANASRESGYKHGKEAQLLSLHICYQIITNNGNTSLDEQVKILAL